MNERLKKAALQAASYSKAKKRKVGCALALEDGTVVIGWNHVVDAQGKPDWDAECEDETGQTLNGERWVKHAEVHALEAAKGKKIVKVVVTHPPCVNCETALLAAGIEEWDVVETFLKFDGTKLRYDLMPVYGYEEIVKGLTAGAKKYKPNNWRKVDDTNRYIAATMRHIEAHRKGELIDEETGCLHTALAAINLIFITDLQLSKTKEQ